MRVVDLSQQLPGPYSTLLLSSLGARVTKVEPPGGDAARHIDPVMFRRVSEGKTSVRLNLKDDDDREKLHDLIRDADVFVEGFRPGVAARLGCDFATLSSLNPALVYCSISGFGQSGPDATRPTHDLSLQAIAGALQPDAVVDTVGVPWVDLGVATTAAFLIASHWRTGRAVHLDLAMLDVAASWARVKPGAVADKQPTYGTFATADGATVALALLEDDMWARLCQALDLADWSAQEGLATHAARVAAHDTVRGCIEKELGRRTLAELAALAVAHDLPLDEVRSLAAADQHDQVAWRRATSNQLGRVPFGPHTGVRPTPFTQP